ncbi:hypothetical protein CONLIGDRAFT_443616 [Coniochaeta ligniaria NRRL 30616]|uniref:Uncharacterized protein n=1 Tax=Coniochaeta ligniaria NRRL 30616 TaxID=1408157 RepID=A0A1J7IK47_9PEZI|nr:hypothetical protein CONLIGDRAFT_443616 [Coniochaeta ligniaria NRRL 30616]
MECEHLQYPTITRTPSHIELHRRYSTQQVIVTNHWSAILVGDDVQLPPTVKSANVENQEGQSPASSWLERPLLKFGEDDGLGSHGTFGGGAPGAGPREVECRLCSPTQAVCKTHEAHGKDEVADSD